MKNRGYTLSEVVVAMIVLSVTFIGVFTAFMAIRKVNAVSRVGQTEMNIATSVIESFHDINYEAIDEDMDFRLPSNLSYTKDDNLVSYSDITDSKIFRLENINGTVSKFDIDITATPVDKGENFEIFNNFKVLSDSGTKIINLGYIPSDDESSSELIESTEGTDSEDSDSSIDTSDEELEDESSEYVEDDELTDDSDDGSSEDESSEESESSGEDSDSTVELSGNASGYDLLAVNKFINKNNLSMDAEELAQYISNDITVGVSKTDTSVLFTCNMVYSLNYSASYNKFRINICDEAELEELSNLIILIPDGVVGSRSISITNGSNENDVATFNIIVISSKDDVSTYDSKNLFETLTDVDFSYEQGIVGDEYVKLLTNVSDVYNTVDIQNKSRKIFELQKSPIRVYNVDVTVHEAVTGTFNHLSKDIVVLRYRVNNSDSEETNNEENE